MLVQDFSCPENFLRGRLAVIFRYIFYSEGNSWRVLLHARSVEARHYEDAGAGIPHNQVGRVIVTSMQNP